MEIKSRAQLAQKGTLWTEVVRGYEYDDVSAFWFYKNGKKYGFFVFERDLFEPVLVVRAWDFVVVANIGRRISQMKRVYPDANGKMKNSSGTRTLDSMEVMK